MRRLEANSADAAQEKHVPVVEKSGEKITVKVGSADHPMTPEHSIEWIAVSSPKGTQRIALSPSDSPRAEFAAVEDPVVFAYCNLHGLWKA
jgi:superoxide reductase